MLSLAFRPDGKCLACACVDKTIRLWDVAGERGDAPNDEPLATLAGHEAAVTTVAFSPDGLLLASGSKDNTVRLWNLAAGTQQPVVPQILRGHGGTVGASPLLPIVASMNCVTFSPDGHFLASGGGDHTVRLWTVATGQEAACFRGSKTFVLGVAFSPDGARLASRSTNVPRQLTDLKVWEVQTGRLLDDLPIRGGGRGVAWSQSGECLASTEDRMVRVWSPGARGGAPTLPGEVGNRGHMASSPDGQRLAVRGRDGTTWILDVPSGREFARLPGTSFEPSRLALGDGLLAVTGKAGVQVWDCQTERGVLEGPRCVLRHDQPMEGMAIRPARPDRLGSQIVVAHKNAVLVWDLPAGAKGEIHEPRQTLRSESPLGGVLAFSPDGKLLVAAGSGKSASILCWNLENGELVGEFRGVEQKVAAVVFSPNGALLACAGSDKTVRLWEVTTGREIACLRGHGETINGLAFSPDGRKLVSVAGTLKNMVPTVAAIKPQATKPQPIPGELKVWDMEIRQEPLTLTEVSGDIHHVTFVGPQGNVLALGCRDRLVRLLEAPSPCDK